MNKFIDCYNKDMRFNLNYNAGVVVKDGKEFIIAYEMNGARKTFSIGQPVYDKDKNLMGYLGMGLYDALDYSTKADVRIPVEKWVICLPTKDCEEGKQVYTYWQVKGGVADADSD